jgi:hypothetical protein
VRQKARKGRITCRTKNRGPWSKAKSTSEIVLCQQPRTKKHTHIFKQLGPWVFFWGTGGAPSAERKYRTLNLRNQQYPAIAPPGGGQKGGSTPFPTRCRGHPTAGVTPDKQSVAGGIEPPATEPSSNGSRPRDADAVPWNPALAPNNWSTFVARSLRPTIPRYRRGPAALHFCCVPCKSCLVLGPRRLRGSLGSGLLVAFDSTAGSRCCSASRCRLRRHHHTQGSSGVWPPGRPPDKCVVNPPHAGAGGRAFTPDAASHEPDVASPCHEWQRQ